MIKAIALSVLATLFIFAVSSKLTSPIGASNFNTRVLGDFTVDSSLYLPGLTTPSGSDTVVSLSGGRLSKTVLSIQPSIKTDTFITTAGNTSFMVPAYKIVTDILIIPNGSVMVKAGLSAGANNVFDSVDCSPTYPWADVQPINGMFSPTSTTRVYLSTYPTNITVKYRIVWR